MESAVLTALPFWDKLTPDEKTEIQRSCQEVIYPAGATIHQGQNDCIGIIFVCSGMLRTYMLSEEGKEITLFRTYKGGISVLSASCLFDAITFDVFIDAEEESRILIIPSSVILKIKEENPQAQNFFLQTVTEHFSDVMWAMQQILFMSFDKRLAIFLLDELSKNNSKTIRLTHEQIAKYMGSAREVVSRMLKYFAAEGWVRLFRGGIEIINKPALLSLTQ